jgi:hypothetical protein
MVAVLEALGASAAASVGQGRGRPGAPDTRRKAGRAPEAGLGAVAVSVRVPTTPS